MDTRSNRKRGRNSPRKRSPKRDSASAEYTPGETLSSTHQIVTQPKCQDGVRCPKCGRRLFSTTKTRHRGSKTIRWRRCRGCRHRIRTAEVIESNAA